MREVTYATYPHPEFLGAGWQRVDHPELAPLTVGEPTLGWQGDPRLAIYKGATRGEDGRPRTSYVLYRLEADGEYRPVCAIQGTLGVETVSRLCARLVEIDGQRGWDPLAVIAQEDAYRAKAARDRQTAFIGDFADKFQFALRWSHLPGVDIVRPRQAPTRG